MELLMEQMVVMRRKHSWLIPVILTIVLGAALILTETTPFRLDLALCVAAVAVFTSM